MGEKVKRKAIIFSGGDVLDYIELCKTIGKDDYIICADSGYRHAKKMNIIPNILVGDFDSIESIPSDINTLKLSPTKDYSDTDFAINHAQQEGYNNIVVIGGTGGRLDHTFANIQSLVRLTRENINVIMTDGITEILCYHTKDKWLEFELSPKEDYYFSVFSYSGRCKNVTIKDGKYELENFDLKDDTGRAISNEFLGKKVKIKFFDGTMLIMCTPMNNI